MSRLLSVFLVTAVGVALHATTPDPSTTAKPAATPPAVLSPQAKRGQKLFANVCAACHLPDGSGVPGLQPALIRNAVVRGDPVRLIRVVLQGPAKVLPPDRPKYAGAMPTYATLTDANLADVLTFLRTGFGNDASPISVEEVANARGGMKTTAPPGKLPDDLRGVVVLHRRDAVE